MIHDEGYSINVSKTLNSVSMFLYDTIIYYLAKRYMLYITDNTCGIYLHYLSSCYI